MRRHNIKGNLSKLLRPPLKCLNRWKKPRENMPIYLRLNKSTCRDTKEKKLKSLKLLRSSKSKFINKKKRNKSLNQRLFQKVQALQVLPLQLPA